MIASAAAVAVDCLHMSALLMDQEESKPGRKIGSSIVKRKRREIDDHFDSLGTYLFRRMYRMHKVDFEKLYHMLLPALPNGNIRTRGATPNGDISLKTRLAMALRFCAGGDRMDIAATHVVHPLEVYKSLWMVVDAINETPSLDIEFPANHDKQQQLADEFASKSKADITQCCAAVDGMLIWTHMPTEKMDDLGVGPAKFYDGRKKKFGLTMQGTCDARKRFLDIYIAHPGSAGDFTVWLDCPLRRYQLELEGFLKEGLVLFGDNAYINTPYMVTPFKGNTTDAQDAYNFYHSQLRIHIECAFGMLVHRWGCLRKPMPMHFGTHKISRLVLAMCKLHNFCIDCNHSDVAPTYQDDVFNISQAGGFDVSSSEDANIINGLIHRSSAEDGYSNRAEQGARKASQRAAMKAAGTYDDLPIAKIFKHIKDNNYKRPPPLQRSPN